MTVAEVRHCDGAVGVLSIRQPCSTASHSGHSVADRRSTGHTMPYYIPPDTCQIKNIDAIYQRYFGRRTRGSFVEIGAYDGESFSNTSFLADLGWSGLYVEPVPAFAALCRARHRANAGVVVDEVAVSDETGPRRIHLGGTLTSLRDDYVDACRDIDWAKGHHSGETIEVPTDRLDALLEKHKIPREFDLLVVDVEGYEGPVIRSVDLSTWRPRMIVIELEDKHPDFLKLESMIEEKRATRARILAAGYRLVSEDIINSIFIRGSDESSTIPAVPRDLSIGMPVYNGERFVGPAIESLLNQSHRDFELIISDNHSTDSTPDIIGRYKAADERIRYVRRPKNFGAIDNFRFVTSLADSTYFMWAAHDDRWRTDFVRSILARLKSNPDAALGFCHFRTLNLLSGEESDLARPMPLRRTDLDGIVRSFSTPISNLIYGIMKRQLAFDFVNGDISFDWADVYFAMFVLTYGDIDIVPEDLYRAGVKDTVRKIVSADGIKVRICPYLLRTTRLIISRFGLLGAARIIPPMAINAIKMWRHVRAIEIAQAAHSATPR